MVQPLDEHQKPIGKSYLAIDNISSAGKGDTVLVMDNGKIVHRGEMAALAADVALQEHLLGLSLEAHQ